MLFEWHLDEGRVGCNPPYEQSEGQDILLAKYVSDVPVPEQVWNRVCEIVAEAARTLGAGNATVFKNAPDDHDVQFSSETGTVLRVASQKLRAAAPMRFHAIGELKLLDGADGTDRVRRVGNIWRAWGWYVVERDGYSKSNEFGYAPDGYRLQIESAPQPGCPPSVEASSPCSSGQIARDDIPAPAVIAAS
ncbi:LppA family lipoprotein [Mycolicibacterium sarraceniae]|uniref:Uncharacterized protein n=1 Tax=Mycolicibacterium sarraceniae TaxID=1534348 RepID=A0A7I7SLX8_9MYCO|nr:LppA family lipoprotein [Mycolicibacterium sarraceniae]BBY57015.1 hypothetical protein MSAR_01510 [Mycolicibacterium sarraceniae]